MISCIHYCNTNSNCPCLLLWEPLVPLGRTPVYQQTLWSVKITLLNFFFFFNGLGAGKDQAGGRWGEEGDL